MALLPAEAWVNNPLPHRAMRLRASGVPAGGVDGKGVLDGLGKYLHVPELYVLPGIADGSFGVPEEPV